jgi:hypothetical protein
MLRRHPWVIAIVIGLVFGWVAAGGVTLLTDDTSGGGASSSGGSAGAEWAVGIGAGAIAALVVGLGLQRAAGRGVLGEPERLAGGVGEESATANPEPGPDPEDGFSRGSKPAP